ncbi:MAG: sugar kinase [Magnetococcales bacterium]|nr:sugar kinase [Magnetococcales bacterium]
MADPLARKIVLVVRQTRLDELVARYNTIEQARFYIEHLGSDFSDYLSEHFGYQTAVARAGEILRNFGLVQRLERRFLPNFIFGPEDTVVVLGQDGLVANTLKYLDGQRVTGVNPDPARWDGVLLPFTIDDLDRVMGEETARKRPVKVVSMARATLNNGQSLLAVNDLFIGKKSHVSARYLLDVGDRQEVQSSSGIIISTGLGSTGWLKSIYSGWMATTQALLGTKIWELMPNDTHHGAFPWESDHLHWFVREPFPSRTTAAELVIGRIDKNKCLRLVSQMPEEGVIFSDGVEVDHIEFNSGTEAIVTLAEKRGLLVV